MAAIHELLAQVQDESLRARLEDEINKLSKTKKFGLVFEEHLPECTPLYDVPIKVGATVTMKDSMINDLYIVTEISDEKAICINKADGANTEILLNNIVCVAELGESIYPYLQTIDTICNAPDSNLWHTLIEADNYHALQLLEYMYAGQVDCIYIDPPYNKEDSKDWKYNCNYVDGNDMYRHSKWLSMMERRLRLAKKLLNPKDSVLIVTINELEYLHLGMLLEQLFPDARIQMITDVINPHGANRKNMFARVEEYIFYVFIGDSSISHTNNDMLHPVEKRSVPWSQLIRCGASGTRAARPNQFYPVFFQKSDGKFHSIGESLPLNVDRNTVIPPEGTFAVFPINNKTNTESCWGLYPQSFMDKYNKGYLKFGLYKEGTDNRAIKHLQSGMIEKIESGDIPIIGYDKDGGVICGDANITIRTLSLWNQASHDAGKQGSDMLQKIYVENRFPFPKSVYAVQDALRFIVKDKPNALIVDFFAGSGTTLHAVNLLNAEDGGRRRCIMVTNNEIGEKAEKEMKAAGFNPGDPEWEKIGIARFATWPRTVCSITGKDINGNALEGDYFTSLLKEKTKKRKVIKIDFAAELLSNKQKKSLVKVLLRGDLPQNLVEDGCDYILSTNEKHTSSILFNMDAANNWIDELSNYEHVTDFYVVTNNQKQFNAIKKTIEETIGEYTIEEPLTIPMSEGFKANAIYFKLGFLDKNAVALGRQLREMIPMLWMKAGACGPCPSIGAGEIPQMVIYEENSFAVLIDETAFANFADRINDLSSIRTVYIVTDSNAGYREMKAGLKAENTYQLYRDYLDNFRIKVGRK